MLLLDEPTSGLDPIARAEFREQLKVLQGEGKTILISSHNLSDLEDICARVALIAEGRNATDAEGRNMLLLGSGEGSEMTCEVHVTSGAEAAALRAGEFEGARLLEVDDRRLCVKLAGDDERAAAFLRHLVTAGVSVVRFAAGVPGLEERYRQVFGGGKQ